jgi:hypothetical protein
MAHVKCPQCGGYVSRSVEACPGCGYFLPGHRILKRLIVLLVLATVLTLAIVIVTSLWRPAVGFFGDIAAHDAKLEHRVSQMEDQKQRAEKEAKDERPDLELDRIRNRGR